MAGRGEFPRLDGPDDLWNILSTIIERKAAELYRDEEQAQRARERIASTAPTSVQMTPAELALQKDQEEHLLGLLLDSVQRGIVLARIDEYTNQEIADMYRVDVRSVERQLNRIRARVQRDKDREKRDLDR